MRIEKVVGCKLSLIFGKDVIRTEFSDNGQPTTARLCSLLWSIEAGTWGIGSSLMGGACNCYAAMLFHKCKTIKALSHSKQIRTGAIGNSQQAFNPHLVQNSSLATEVAYGKACSLTYSMKCQTANRWDIKQPVQLPQMKCLIFGQAFHTP